MNWNELLLFNEKCDYGSFYIIYHQKLMNEAQNYFYALKLL